MILDDANHLNNFDLGCFQLASSYMCRCVTTDVDKLTTYAEETVGDTSETRLRLIYHLLLPFRIPSPNPLFPVAINKRSRV